MVLFPYVTEAQMISHLGPTMLRTEKVEGAFWRMNEKADRRSRPRVVRQFLPGKYLVRFSESFELLVTHAMFTQVFPKNF